MATEIVPAGGGAAGIPAAGLPAGDLVGDWLRGRKPGTVRGYQADLADFARFASPGGASVAAVVDGVLGLDAGTVNRLVLNYRNHLTGDRGLSSATVNRRLAAVKSLVKMARLVGRVSWTVEVRGVPAEAREDRSGPDEADLRKLTRASKAKTDATGLRDRALFVLAAGLGLRRHTLCSVDLADVDFPRRRIRILGKGKRERAEVELPPDVCDALAAWAAVRGPDPGAFFCRTDRGSEAAGALRQPLSGESVRAAVRRIAAAARVAGPVRPHGLRHSFATKLVRRGETVQAVAAALGHAKIQTTLAYFDTKADDAARCYRKGSEGV